MVTYRFRTLQKNATIVLNRALEEKLARGPIILLRRPKHATELSGGKGRNSRKQPDFDAKKRQNRRNALQNDANHGLVTWIEGPGSRSGKGQ